MNTIVPVTRARQQFFKLIQMTELPGSSVTITIDGEPKVVMLSIEEFEGWQETLEIMSDKALMAGIAEGMENVKEGQILDEKEVLKNLNLK